MMISALATIFVFFSVVDSTTLSQNRVVSTVTVGPPSNCTVVEAVWEATQSEACNSTLRCCTTEYLQALAAVLWCNSDTGIAPITGPAFVQYSVSEQATNCRSRGHQVDDVRLQLSPAQTDFLNYMYRRDEQVRQKQTAFFAFQVAGGHVGLPLLVLVSILFRKAHRDPAFFNFCLTWFVSSVVFCVLLYQGTEGHTFDVPYGDLLVSFSRRCFIQASLIPGVQAMTSCSTVALIIQLWLRLRTAIYGVTISPIQSRLITTALIMAPWILLISFSVAASYVTTIRVAGSSISNIFYCTVQLNSRSASFLRAEYGIVIVFILMTLVWDVLLVKTMYLHWSAYRSKSAVSLSILVRVAAFSLFRVVVAIAYATVLFSTQIDAGVIIVSTGETLVNLVVPVWVDLSQAALPLVAFLVLGTTKETLATLMFWRTISKSRQAASSEGDNRTYPLTDLQDTHPDVHDNADRTVHQ
ncbi:hypothetical protein JB92DRAFT_3048575 [Gautieria morchelliformis]|nr:hypothetical protein JB92DRAFT_3048575 [Gautieria morchelliformis]